LAGQQRAEVLGLGWVEHGLSPGVVVGRSNDSARLGKFAQRCSKPLAKRRFPSRETPLHRLGR